MTTLGKKSSRLLLVAVK